MDSCGMQLAKYLLFGFNLVFSLTALIIIIAGAVVFVSLEDYNSFVDSSVIGPPIVLIITGLIIFLIAFLGCWGALRENSNMLIAYTVLLLIIFILEFAAGVTAAVTKENFVLTMESAMQTSLSNYKEDAIHKETWDLMQQKLECCGVIKRSDWVNKLDNAVVPSSCCKDMAPGKCENKTISESQQHGVGCFFKLQDKVRGATLALAGVGIGIAFIELAGIVLALLLIYSIRKSAPKK